MRRKNSQTVRILYDLWIGIFLYFIILEIIGIIFVAKRLSYTLGLLFGCIVAVFLAWHMYISIKAALDMDVNHAEIHVQKSSGIRTIVMLVAAFAGMKLAFFSFPAVIAGVMSLKMAAFVQPYMTNKFLEKRGE